MTTLSRPGSRSCCNNTDKPALNITKGRAGGEDGDRDWGADTQDMIPSGGVQESQMDQK